MKVEYPDYLDEEKYSWEALEDLYEQQKLDVKRKLDDLRIKRLQVENRHVELISLAMNIRRPPEGTTETKQKCRKIQYDSIRRNSWPTREFNTFRIPYDGIDPKYVS